MRLHQMQDSDNCYKVRLTMAHLGLSAELISVDILSEESRKDDCLGSLNANGRVPVLELADGTALAESNAIIWYLAEEAALVPADKPERVRALQWLFFEQYSHEPFIATVRFWRHILADPKGHTAQIEERTSGGYAAVGVMEQHLSGSTYFTNSFPVADIALYAYRHVAHEGGFDLGGYPAVQRWLEAVAAQPRHIRIEERSW